MVTVLLVVLGFATGAVATFSLRSHLIYAAYAEGKRQAFKRAIQVTLDRGEIATMLTPLGRLRDGMLRAQMAHEVCGELRDELKRVE